MARADALAGARAEFPLLESCVYLNSNSTGAFPRGVETVLHEYWSTLRTWRDSHWERWWPALLAHGDSLAAFLGAPMGSVVTDANMSSVLGRFVTSLVVKPARRRVICTSLDFPTVPFLLRRMQRLGAEIVVVPMDRSGAFDEAALEAAIDERTLVACCSHASYVTGALLDVERIAAHCAKVGALSVIDGYQAVGVVPVDVTALGVDAYAGGSHKWLCGSPDEGFLYVKPSVAAATEPLATGWVASENPLAFADVDTFAPGARRFASGTPGVLGALASEVGLQILSGVGIHTIRDVSLEHTARVLARAADERWPIATPREPQRRGGVVGLRLPEAPRVVELLARQNMVCSQRASTLRIAPHFYNTTAEVDAFLEALARAVREAKS